MKAKINLYNRPSGRIDTYQPYNTSKPQSPAPAKDTVVVNRDNRLDAAYSANYGQACLLLRAIQMNGRRRLSNNCILQLAIFVAKAWETNPGKDKIDALAKLMTNLLDTTLLCPDKPFDEALKQFCRNNIPTHSVSPSITLLIAIGYIERLKQRYANIKGTTGCGHRLIMVAYMMAAKFMHVNLKSIINVQSSTETATVPPTTETATATATATTTTATTTARTSAERSTISYTQTLPPIIPKNDQLPSPPTSPKAYSNSDPLNYHYFQSPSKKSTYTTPTVNINHKERHFQILRMELEFLHFLNYDLSLTDTLKLIHWAQNFDDDTHYTSADEGGDEWDTED